MIVFLTACMSESTRNKILEQLRKKDYIKENWEQIDFKKKYTPGNDIPSVDYFEYIYSDKTNYYCVSIRNTNSRDEFDVLILYNIDYVKGEEQSKYKYTHADKKRTIHMKESSFFIFKSWDFEEKLEDLNKNLE